MEDVLVCALSVFFTETGGKKQAWPSDPIRKTKLGKQNQRASRGAKATGMSEVGSHRITKDENSFTGWTGPLKRI
jgi:hypothetical protein